MLKIMKHFRLTCRLACKDRIRNELAELDIYPTREQLYCTEIYGHEVAQYRFECVCELHIFEEVIKHFENDKDFITIYS